MLKRIAAVAAIALTASVTSLSAQANEVPSGSALDKLDQCYEQDEANGKPVCLENAANEYRAKIIEELKSNGVTAKKIARAVNALDAYANASGVLATQTQMNVTPSSYVGGQATVYATSYDAVTNTTESECSKDIEYCLKKLQVTFNRQAKAVELGKAEFKSSAIGALVDAQKAWKATTIAMCGSLPEKSERVTCIAKSTHGAKVNNLTRKK